jgi:hypothetical protein
MDVFEGRGVDRWMSDIDGDVGRMDHGLIKDPRSALSPCGLCPDPLEDSGLLRDVEFFQSHVWRALTAGHSVTATRGLRRGGPGRFIFQFH